MAMFWEFFTFELRFRLKSISTYVYFLLWFAFCLLLGRLRKLRPGRQLQRQGPAQRTRSQTRSTTIGSSHLRRHRHRRHLRHLHPPRLSTRHLPDPLHQAHLQVRLPRRPLGRLLPHHRLCLFRDDLRHLHRHLCALGRSRPHRPQPPLVVPPAVPLHHRRSDLLSRLALLRRRRPHPQDLSSSICRASRSSCCTSSASPSSPPRARSSTSGPASSTPSASSSSTTSPATGPSSKRTPSYLPWDLSGNSKPGVFLYNRFSGWP